MDGPAGRHERAGGLLPALGRAAVSGGVGGGGGGGGRGGGGRGEVSTHRQRGYAGAHLQRKLRHCGATGAGGQLCCRQLVVGMLSAAPRLLDALNSPRVRSRRRQADATSRHLKGTAIDIVPARPPVGRRQSMDAAASCERSGMDGPNLKPISANDIIKNDH